MLCNLCWTGYGRLQLCAHAFSISGSSKLFTSSPTAFVALDANSFQAWKATPLQVQQQQQSFVKRHIYCLVHIHIGEVQLLRFFATLFCVLLWSLWSSYGAIKLARNDRLLLVVHIITQVSNEYSYVRVSMAKHKVLEKNLPEDRERL